jgi:hypothetical protein
MTAANNNYYQMANTSNNGQFTNNINNRPNRMNNMNINDGKSSKLFDNTSKF